MFKITSLKATNIYVQFALALSAGSALIYEVVVTESLFFYFTESSYSIATMLSVFLFGLAVGSYIMHLLLSRVKNKRLLFGCLQLASGFYAFFILTHLTSIIPEITQFGVFVSSFAILLVPTIILGAVFPLAGSIFKRDGEKIGVVYSSDLVGAILGAMLAGFLLIPIFGLSFAVMVGAILNIVSATIIFKSKKIKLFSFIVLAVFLFVVFFPLESELNEQSIYQDQSVLLEIEQFIQQEQPLLPYHLVIQEVGKEDYLFSEHSPYGTVSVREGAYLVSAAPFTIVDALYIDERIQCVYQYNPNASEIKIVDYSIDPLKIENPHVLSIGLGCGTTLLNVLNKTDTQVDVVEINPVVVKSNKIFSSVLMDSRVNVILDNGLDHLRTGGNYDSIILDIEHPSIVHSSNLYTVEAFGLVVDSLEDHGTFGLWSYPGSDRYLDIIYYTLKEEFDYVSYPFEKVFVSSNYPLPYDEYVPTSTKAINTIDRKILYDVIN